MKDFSFKLKPSISTKKYFRKKIAKEMYEIFNCLPYCENLCDPSFGEYWIDGSTMKKFHTEHNNINKEDGVNINGY